MILCIYLYASQYECIIVTNRSGQQPHNWAWIFGFLNKCTKIRMRLMCWAPMGKLHPRAHSAPLSYIYFSAWLTRSENGKWWWCCCCCAFSCIADGACCCFMHSLIVQYFDVAKCVFLRSAPPKSVTLYLWIFFFFVVCVLVSDNVTSSVNRYMYEYEIKMHFTHFISISVWIRVSLWFVCVCVLGNGACICMSIMFERICFFLLDILWKYLCAAFF